MELKILKETEAPLLSRKRVNVEINFDGVTPSEKEVLKNLSSKLRTKEELISIRHIYTKYGGSKAKVIAHLYNSVDELKNVEEIKKKKVGAQKQEENKEVKEDGKEKKQE